MRIGTWAGIILVCCAGSEARAGYYLSFGNTVLLPGRTGQVVPVYVSHKLTDAPVAGFNLRATLGDGTGPLTGAVFQSLDWTSGPTIWSGHSSTVIGGIINGYPQDAQAGIALSAAGDTVSASGTVVNMVIDTTAATNGGTYALKLSGTEIGADSAFVTASSASGEVRIPNANTTLRVLIPGDINRDGAVDFTDAQLFLNDYGQSTAASADPWGSADFNGDGVVDYQDFLTLAAHLGQSLNGVAPSMSASPSLLASYDQLLTAVPEPSALVTLLAPGMLLLARRAARSATRRR